MYALSEQEQNLLQKADLVFPGRKIQERFNRCAALPKEQRYEYTLNEMKNLPRQGLKRIGLTEVQSLFSHTKNMVAMAKNNEKQMAIVHDMPEALTTDFCHVDVGSRRRKRLKVALESLAAKIIFENHPKLFALWDEYEDRQTERSIAVKALDMLEWKKVCDIYNQAANDMHPVSRTELQIFLEKAQKVCRRLNIKESDFDTDKVVIENYRHQDGDSFKPAPNPRGT